MSSPRVLIGCESSGVVREAFRRRGFYAMSADFLETEQPGEHYRGNVLDVLDEGWDLAIFHPTCTYLTCAAEWAYTDGPYHQKVKPGTLVGQERREAREAAIAFALTLWSSRIPRVAIENPVGVLSRHLPKPYVIQPHEFGHDASKATCIFSRGLPRLKPTAHVAPRIVDGRPRWANQTDTGQNRLSPSADRWKIRSRTFDGIGDAMADQWGAELEKREAQSQAA